MAIEVNYISKCCGMKEITGLSIYTTDSQTSMLRFCEVIYPDPAANKARVDDLLKKAEAAGVPNDQPYNAFYGSGARNGSFTDAAQYSRFRFATFTEALPYATPNDLLDDNPRYKYGRAFAAFIRENALGSLVETGYEVNPNSGNRLKVWVWGIDHTALKSWYEKNKPSVRTAQPLQSALFNAANVANVILGGGVGR